MRSPVGQQRAHPRLCELDRTNRFEQYVTKLDEVVGCPGRQAVVTRYYAALSDNRDELLTQTAAVLRFELFQQVIESHQKEGLLTVITHFRGVPLQSYLNSICEDTLCCWLLQLLAFNYGIIEKNRNFVCDYLQPNKIHIDGNRLILLPPNVFASPVSAQQVIKDFMNYLLEKEQVRGKLAPSGGPLKHLIRDVCNCQLTSKQAIASMIHRIRQRDSIVHKSNSIPVMLFKNNRRYVRKNSIITNKKDPTFDITKNLIRKVSSSGKLHPSVKLEQHESPYRRPPLVRNNPLNAILLNDREHQSSKNTIPKMNRLTFLRKKQTNFQSEKQIKGESPEKPNCGVQTDRRSQQTVAFGRFEQPKSIEKKLQLSRQPKPRRQSKVERKLIIRNPFEKKQLQQRFIDFLDESAIERRLSSIWEDSQLNNMVRELDGSPQT